MGAIRYTEKCETDVTNGVLTEAVLSRGIIKERIAEGRPQKGAVEGGPQKHAPEVGFQKEGLARVALEGGLRRIALKGAPKKRVHTVPFPIGIYYHSFSLSLGCPHTSSTFHSF